MQIALQMAQNSMQFNSQGNLPLDLKQLPYSIR